MNGSHIGRIGFDEALSLLRDAATPVPAEAIPLAQALGGVLAEDVTAPIDLQPFDNAAMDGFAVRAADLRADGVSALRLVGEQYAGPARDLAVGPGECVRITTGAPLPAGADSVLPKEEARLADGRVIAACALTPGTHVRRRGEDVRRGEVVLHAGQVVTPVRLGMLAALGFSRVPLRRRPHVAVFSSGDELRPAGEPLRPGEIHDSNGPMLQALLAREGIQAAPQHLPDDRAAVTERLRAAARSADLVLTCGGVSAGEKDLLPAVLAQHGEVVFWKVRIKPGMPVLFGRLDGALVLGLPGNPVSVLATFLTLAQALLDALQGRSEARAAWRARLAAPVDKPHDRLEFRRGRLEVDEHGGLRVHPDPATGSHRLRAAAQANALIVLPEGPLTLEAGALVHVLPYGEFGAR
ncbi:MAG: gephyrin-like molybdotransferase Glp [Rehaibacterium terrae]|uniref:molybdopterin molybdotransferase MoeA n=1 Tax=Rehaibacterium terrae TaxID=1341696 RepID=UPI00391DFB90